MSRVMVAAALHNATDLVVSLSQLHATHDIIVQLHHQKDSGGASLLREQGAHGWMECVGVKAVKQRMRAAARFPGLRSCSPLRRLHSPDVTIGTYYCVYFRC